VHLLTPLLSVVFESENRLAKMADSTLSLVFNHVVLPPKLPGTQDNELERVEKELLLRLYRAAEKMKEICSDEGSQLVWEHILQTLDCCKLIHQDGHIPKNALLNVFPWIQEGHPLLIYIADQNAALLIRPPSRYVI
jgi:hypothetical protein